MDIISRGIANGQALAQSKELATARSLIQRYLFWAQAMNSHSGKELFSFAAS